VKHAGNCLRRGQVAKTYFFGAGLRVPQRIDGVRRSLARARLPRSRRVMCIHADTPLIDALKKQCAETHQVVNLAVCAQQDLGIFLNPILILLIY